MDTGKCRQRKLVGSDVRQNTAGIYPDHEQMNRNTAGSKHKMWTQAFAGSGDLDQN